MRRCARDRIGYAYRRTKVLGQQAWTRSERVLGEMDKVAHLASEGLRVLGDRLDPDVRDGASKVSHPIHEYAFQNEECPAEPTAGAVKDTGTEY